MEKEKETDTQKDDEKVGLTVSELDAVSGGRPPAHHETPHSSDSDRK